MIYSSHEGGFVLSKIIDFCTDLALTICFGVKELAVFLVSMVPMIELKGGIAVGLKDQFGFGYGMAFLWAFLGSSFVCIPLYWLVKWLFKFKFFARIKKALESKAAKLSKRIENMQTSDANPKKVTFWKCVGVFVFAMIPIPLTGVWTSTVVAVMLNLKFRWAVPVIFLGNAVAGGFILLLLWLIGPANLNIFLLVLFGLVLILLAWFLWKVFKPEKKPKPIAPAPDAVQE